MRGRLKQASLLLALVLASVEASAHGPDVGVHGGPQIMAGVFHVEIVSRDKTVTVYLMDHSGRSVATAGYAGAAVPSDASEEIALAPAGDNILAGSAKAPLASEFKGVVRITSPNGAVTQAKF